jgi:hypothetical protein
MENLEKQEERKSAYKKRKKRAYKKEKRWYPIAGAQPLRSGDCASAWTSFLRKGGNRGRLSGSSTYY